jgi:hypothetical protein
MSRWLFIGIVIAALVIGGVGTGVAVGARGLAPARVALYYPWDMLAQEAETMIDCVECHKPDTFHGCQTCHDDHGSAAMAGVPFNDLLLLEGDVPAPGYIPINDILPYPLQPNTRVALLDFLADRGVTEFESVTLASRDGGFVTFERPNLTGEALLMPHVDGMRFAAENLHVSTWLKGVWRMIVVGPDKPLEIDGQPTSMGRLLQRPTQSVTIEQVDVMLRSGTDGQIRKGKTASRIEGPAIRDIVADPDFEQLIVVDGDGREYRLAASEARGAMLIQFRGQAEATLVLPDRSRAQWVGNVVEIWSEK